MRKSKKQMNDLRKNVAALTVWAVICGAVVLLVLWALTGFVSSLNQKRTLIHSGVRTTATVTGHTSQFHTGGRGSFSTYLISYTFSAATSASKNQTITAQNVELHRGDWQKLHVGSKFNVMYLANKPSTNQPTNSVTQVSPNAVLIIGWIISFALFYALFYALSLIPKKYFRKGLIVYVIYLAVIVGALFVGFFLSDMLSGLIAYAFLR